MSKRKLKASVLKKQKRLYMMKNANVHSRNSIFDDEEYVFSSSEEELEFWNNVALQRKSDDTNPDTDTEIKVKMLADDLENIKSRLTDTLHSVHRILLHLQFKPPLKTNIPKNKPVSTSKNKAIQTEPMVREKPAKLKSVLTNKKKKKAIPKTSAKIKCEVYDKQDDFNIGLEKENTYMNKETQKASTSNLREKEHLPQNQDFDILLVENIREEDNLHMNKVTHKASTSNLRKKEHLPQNQDCDILLVENIQEDENTYMNKKTQKASTSNLREKEHLINNKDSNIHQEPNIQEKANVNKPVLRKSSRISVPPRSPYVSQTWIIGSTRSAKENDGAGKTIKKRSQKAKVKNVKRHSIANIPKQNSTKVLDKKRCLSMSGPSKRILYSPSIWLNSEEFQSMEVN